MPRSSRRGRLALLSLAALVGFCIPASVANADPICQNDGVYMLFARGSGAAFESDQAVAFRGAVGNALVARNVHARVWAELGNLNGDFDRQDSLDSGEYPAINALWASTMPPIYNASVDVGADEVITHLNDRSIRCPREAFVMGGYSQGADVLGAALSRSGSGGFTAAAKRHIAFVGLYGDPHANRYGPSVACRGDTPCWGTGVLGGRGPYVPDDFKTKVGSWCDTRDFICNGLPGDGTHTTAYQNRWIWESANEIAVAALGKMRELNSSPPPPAPAPSYPTEVGSPKLAATRNQDGRLALFYVGTDYSIYYQYQLNPGGWWGPEHRIDAHAKGIAVTTSADGRIEIFYIGGDNSIVHKYQTSPNSHSWSAEEYFGTSVRGIAAARNGAGQVAVATVDWNHQIHIRKQNSPNSWGGTNWQHLPAVALDIGMTTSADGRNEMFYVGGNGNLIHRWEMWVGGNWSGEEGHSARICKVAAARNHDGRLEVFAIGDNNRLYNKWQWQPNYPWFDSWGGLNGVATQPASAVNADGRIELFYVIGDNTIWHQWQNNPGAGQGWSAQSQMYGRVSA